MTTLFPRLAATLRARRTTRHVTRFALADPYRVWQGIQAIDSAVTAHRRQGDVAVTVMLRFEKGDEE